MASVLVVLGLAYVLLSSALEREDRQQIQWELGELLALYRSGGVTAVRDLLVGQEASGTGEPFAVRLLDADGTTRFIWKPAQLTTLDARYFENAPIGPAGEWRVLSRPGATGSDLELTSVPLPDGGRLEVAGSTGDRAEVLQRFRRVAFLVLVPVLALGLVGGTLLASSALRPIRQIVLAVRAVAEGKMGTRVPARWNGDELDELVLLFNEMLERITALMDGMRGALDNVAHELRTPIMRIRGASELALQAGNEPEVLRQAVGECLEELDQLLSMLNALMDISEAEAGAVKLRLESVDLSALIAEVVDLYHLVAQDKALALSTSGTGAPRVMADRGRLRQVVANLLDNAIKYTAPGGRIDISAVEENGCALLRIRDTGIGIAAHELSRIWDRLYRGHGSQSQPGLGLGLSLVRAVVQAHGGRTEVASTPGAGTEFTVVFPAALTAERVAARPAELSRM
ncbi:MAG TPA: HAMP domain-containing sensor histidine kinase [Methylomirabilota bacterium]|nr:HAMP domain-containing sensor histidine kinase [Methylomirabilota bacterium]